MFLYQSQIRAILAGTIGLFAVSAKATPDDDFVSVIPPTNLAAITEKVRQVGQKMAPNALIGLAVEWLPASTRARGYANADVAVNHLSAAKWMWTAAALVDHSINSVSQYARPTFIASDNVAAGELIRLAGGIPAVNSFLHNHVSGTDKWWLCGWGFVAGLGQHCRDNVFTARSALPFLEAVYDERLGLPADKANALDSWATLSPRTGPGGWIGAPLPKSVKSSMRQKAGWSQCANYGQNKLFGCQNINEMAIIKPENGGAYAVVITVRGADVSQSARTISRISCLVYHTFNSPTEDPFASCQYKAI